MVDQLYHGTMVHKLYYGIERVGAYMEIRGIYSLCTVRWYGIVGLQLGLVLGLGLGLVSLVHPVTKTKLTLTLTLSLLTLLPLDSHGSIVMYDRCSEDCRIGTLI